MYSDSESESGIIGHKWIHMDSRIPSILKKKCIGIPVFLRGAGGT